ncbi:pentatricopeptide repeat-containing protein At4g02750 [Selaginella moellendorffii]|uniref:pentatricopeptide repeat-containing protein At4g02750 n=1 Tax=Selaginella moellendorffii TaxID=88036 RepID=UPI000D1CC566|nr:pentatricopeptide repeat-containing protein At4g02750 [Selaginella moellendorffii]|eukprot:XP_024541605.1 pentatricopeptide repeat-containing protein At4g02750 [Selaginella moellendorffii]
MDTVALQAMIRSCGHAKDLAQARRLHALVVQQHQNQDHQQQVRFHLNLLMEMYGKCGSADDAAAIFSTLPRPNLFSWTILLTAFARNGHVLQAREVFDAMPRRDIVAWNALLAASSSTDRLEQAEKVHSKMPHWNASSWNALVAANAEAGHLSQAAKLLHAMPQPNTISWTVMMGAYARAGITDLSVAIFDECIPSGRDVVAWNALVMAYAAAGQDGHAARTFGCMPWHDQVACNVMLHAHCAAGRMGDAARFFHTAMLTHDTVSWNVLLHGYVRLGQLEDAQRVFDATPRKDAASWTAMLTAYGSAGRVDTARRLFDAIPRGTRTVITWNSMLGFFADNVATFTSFRQRMPAWDTTTWNVTVAALARAGQLQQAMEMFESTPQKNQLSWNAVVAANAQAGHLNKAEQFLALAPAPTTNTWNGLIAGYARHSHTTTAFHRFRDMLLCGIPPDNITFVCLLVACSHVGLTAAACRLFRSMQTDWQITPTPDHHSCIVDSIARSGQLVLAQELVESLPQYRPSVVSLVSATAMHCDDKVLQGVLSRSAFSPISYYSTYMSV